jgi:hypothetical protein
VPAIDRGIRRERRLAAMLRMRGENAGVQRFAAHGWRSTRRRVMEERQELKEAVTQQEKSHRVSAHVV